MHPKDAEGIANSVDPDQTAPPLGLHCLPTPVCPKTWENYGMTASVGLFKRQVAYLD